MAEGKINDWDAWYIQKTKINEIYSSISKSRGRLSKLKNFVGWRPTNIKLKLPFAEVDIERIKNIEDKGAYTRLEEIIGKVDLIDLNETNCKDIDHFINKYIYFKGTGEFREHETKNKKVQLRGNVKDYTFLCTCSVEHFSEISSSFMTTLLDAKEDIDGHKLNIFFLGRIKDAYPDCYLKLDGIYISGDTGDVTDLIKKRAYKK
ncbi:hypothetical protein [Candidatus Methanocrinis natronophilus]|uniref:Uncharacterized protein n=1 Tax=Candidatus Methanocrinis natronophilus TaxID=3033396 RepID=A0ABT5X6G4_9EURY|nr:hypothetical protein [Candidatus Methanocrinis natronophilus]MDF0590272.1 hypothetical protein [Candidatus Methanocrinis natronophilus]